MRRARPLLAALLGQCSFTDEPSAPAYEYPRESVQNPCTLAASSCGGVRDSSRTEGFVSDSSGAEGFVSGPCAAASRPIESAAPPSAATSAWASAST